MNIHWRHPSTLTPADRQFVERRIGALAARHDDLSEIWIDGGTPSGHHRSGDARVTIRSHGRHDSVVAIGQEEEQHTALRCAIEKFEREVWKLRERRAERRRGSRRMPILPQAEESV